MAWRNLSKINIQNADVNLMQMKSFDYISQASGWETAILVDQRYYPTDYITTTGDDFEEIFDDGWYTSSNQNTTYLIKDTSASVSKYYVNSTSNGLDIVVSSNTKTAGTYPKSSYDLGFAVGYAISLNDETQMGAITLLQYIPTANRFWMYLYYDGSTKSEDIYNTFVAKSGGGAGSGYIGNSLVSNKKMVGYNVPTSSAEGTKTESVNEVSASAVSGKPKSGNGFARIKFLRDS